jgi:uncharacterized repeat protein (TIGR03803 family)
MTFELRSRRVALRLLLSTIVVAAGGLAIAATSHAALAASLTTLYSFCSQSNCADGVAPRASLASDADGNLYGTTTGGGTNSLGTVFEFAFDGSSYQYRKLYDFCSQAQCADGRGPTSSIVVDVDGNLYGTTSTGGAHLSGVVFRLAPNKHHTAWKLAVLHDFCVQDFCPDGSTPASGLTYQGAQSGALYDGTSPLYGTTGQGGSMSGNGGVAFELVFTPGKKKPKEKVLYNFCSQTQCADGATPAGRLVFDAGGNLFGLTTRGGNANSGTAFELSPVRRGYTQTVLYNFCHLADCADGNAPVGGLVLDQSGNLYGVTQQGGAHSGGTAFKIVNHGVASTESVVYDFCAQASCADGSLPNGDLLLDAGGSLYGTAGNGGNSSNDGLIFKLHAGSLNVLYDFCAQQSCADGALPATGLTMDAAGNFLGVTTFGGSGFIGGTFFRLTP